MRAGGVKGSFISGAADNDPAGGEQGRGSHDCDRIVHSFPRLAYSRRRSRTQSPCDNSARHRAPES